VEIGAPMTNLTVPVQGPSLRPLDRIFRAWRIRKIAGYVRSGSRVCDIGCGDGSLFNTYSDRIVRGVGLDPTLVRSSTGDRFRFIAGPFPSAARAIDERFDLITALAVLEHVEADELPSWTSEFERLLQPGGFLVATVPSPAVDGILGVLARWRLIAGMSLDEHHGFETSRLPSLLSSEHIRLAAHERFELGLNNLFVFKKDGDS
jgi:2-polyprenyl-3-methyl-5-hydroxy-6-metoxy-1,4-benzoquinol methylase